MHKESFIINRNTLLHVSTLLGHLLGELFVTVTLGLHLRVELECGVTSPRSPPPADSSRHQRLRSTQSTAHPHSTVKWNLSVRVKKRSP
jgi:hypothetical protein